MKNKQAVPASSTAVVAVNGAMVKTKRGRKQGWHEGKFRILTPMDPGVLPRI